MLFRSARKSNRQRQRRGASAFEFCVILPLLTLIVLACVDFGRFAYSYIGLTNAARAGAEYGVMNSYLSSQSGTWLAEVERVAREEMAGQTGYVSNNLATIISSGPETNGMRYVRVEVRYPYRPLVPWPGLPGNLTMRRVVHMRAIR